MAQFNYRVEFDDFAERHYIKKFRKKYMDKWSLTEHNIIAVCERIDNMLLYDHADLISEVGSHKLIKLNFAVESTRLSPKASGNRCVLHVNEEIRLVRILLVYSKDDILPPNETQKWKNLIKNEIKEVAAIFNL